MNAGNNMSTQKYSALHTYKAAQVMLTVLAKKLDSAPLLVFPSGMKMTSAGSIDPAFLASWNEQMLEIMQNKSDVKGSTSEMEDIPMSTNEGFQVLIGFLADYEKTLMSDDQMHQVLKTLQEESEQIVDNRPSDGYWQQWSACLGLVKPES